MNVLLSAILPETIFFFDPEVAWGPGLRRILWDAVSWAESTGYCGA